MVVDDYHETVPRVTCPVIGIISLVVHYRRKLDTLTGVDVC